MEENYIFKGTRYDRNGLPKGSAVPAWPFKSPLEIYLPLPLKSPGIKYSEDELNKLFWGTIWDQTKSALKNLDQNVPKDVTLIATTRTEVYVLYVAVDKQAINESVIKKIFDWNGQISFTFGASNGYKPNVTSFGGIYDYSKVKVEFYGYGKKGYSYRGSKMLFID